MVQKLEENFASAFREWFSNFSEDIFVMLKVYADETGTHDGADVVCLSGLIDSRGHWEKFGGKWRKVLKKFDTDFFHYREFRKDANTQTDDPYYGWTDEKRRDFLFELAMLVGETAVPTGGAFATEYNKKIGNNADPFETTIRAFYDSTLNILKMHWPEYTGRVLFIFDNCNERKWTGPLHEIHAEYRDKSQRVGAIAFGDDKKDPEHIALQAAGRLALVICFNRTLPLRSKRPMTISFPAHPRAGMVFSRRALLINRPFPRCKFRPLPRRRTFYPYFHSEWRAGCDAA